MTRPGSYTPSTSSWVPWRCTTEPHHIHAATDEGLVYCGDALEFLNALRDSCADIVFLDPPFNLGKKYGRRDPDADRIDESAYYDFLTDVLDQSVRLLRPGGALYLYHVPFWAMRFASYLRRTLTFRHWIAISMKNGFVLPNGLYPAHYALLYFTNGEPAVFNRPKLPIALCRHCEKPIKDYGGYKQYVRDGVNLSDVWDDLSPVRHAKHKSREANELPLEIPRRVVEMSGCPDGLLIDPFVGAGTTGVAARERGMRFVVCDRDEDSCEVTCSRALQPQAL